MTLNLFTRAERVITIWDRHFERKTPSDILRILNRARMDGIWADGENDPVCAFFEGLIAREVRQSGRFVVVPAPYGVYLKDRAAGKVKWLQLGRWWTQILEFYDLLGSKS